MYMKIAVISRSGVWNVQGSPWAENGSGLSDYGGVISIAWGTMCSKRENVTNIFGA
jgi:hypothetical protein